MLSAASKYRESCAIKRSNFWASDMLARCCWATCGMLNWIRSRNRPTLIYWNDVLEHIPPDEVAEYVSHIYRILAPGGLLVTITPNWLLRPSDVTGDFCPWRTEARGLHLKEYRLAEVTQLLRQAGFRSVATPLFATHQRLYTYANGGRAIKERIELWLERLPVKGGAALPRPRLECDDCEEVTDHR